MNALYQELFASSPDGILLIDAEAQRVIEFNDAACRQLGYTREEFASLRIADYEASETPAETAAQVQKVLREGTIEFDTLQRTKSGAIRHVHVWAKAFDLDGRQVLHAIFRDITERKQVEESLRLFRTLADRSNDAIEVLDPESARFLDVNEQGLRMLGYTREEFLASSVWDVDPTVDRISFKKSVRELRQSDALLWEGVHRRKNGSTFPVEVNLSYVRLDQDYVVAVVRDVSERKAVDESRRLQSAALHAVADAVVITDNTGVIEWVNPAFTELTGYTLDESIGKNPRDLVKSGQHDSAFYKAFWDTILAGRTWHGEIVNRRKDGRFYTENQAVTPIRDASGIITHFVAIKEDITERLQLEAQFQQAQKMDSVGQLASGIAHDFNNLLTVINGMSDLVLEEVGPDSPIHADVKEILHAGKRATALTRQLLAFSRQQILERRVMNLNTVVAGMESLLRRLLGEDIDLIILPGPDLANIKADYGQIEQVITNIAVNARDAMPQGGRLTIDTQNVVIDEAVTFPRGLVIPPGSYVRLTVSDSGVGMDEPTLARIFEPFFTTKGPGKGTGLGLSTVYGIVKQSHGYVWLQSEVGRGTRVMICLPQVTEVSAADQPESAVLSQAGTETILLVDDSTGVRHLARRFLEPAGYTVLDAASGEEALRILDGREGPIHLLLTDVVMPGMSGRRLAEQLTEARPAMKVLYVSGHTADTIGRHGVVEGRVPLLNKPFSRVTLLRRVREVLDS